MEDHFTNMSLLEEEESGVELADEANAKIQDSYRWTLVGRFLAEKHIDFIAMQNLMASLWRPVKGMIVKDLGNALFLF